MLLLARKFLSSIFHVVPHEVVFESSQPKKRGFFSCILLNDDGSQKFFTLISFNPRRDFTEFYFAFGANGRPQSADTYFIIWTIYHRLLDIGNTPNQVDAVGSFWSCYCFFFGLVYVARPKVVDDHRWWCVSSREHVAIATQTTWYVNFLFHVFKLHILMICMRYGGCDSIL